jgi:RNA polymerase sigma-70 factor, ECF subfamily
MTAVRTSLVVREEGALSAPAPIESGLVIRAQKGDGRAFRMIFDRHGGPVRRFLRDLLGDESAVDEAMQETFVRAHSRLHSLRESEKLQSWLLGIARLVFFEQIRSRRHSAPEEAADEPIDEAPTPELALLGQEADKKLTEALAQLSEQRRAALLLRLDHNLGYDEIAEIMGWPLSKVKNEIHRARLQLRQFLSRYVSVRSG